MMAQIMEALHMGDLTVRRTVSPAMMERMAFLTSQRERAREMEEHLANARRGAGMAG